MMRRGVCVALLLASFTRVAADDIRIAVAANFSLPLERIARSYEAGSADRLRISSGSTGKLYAQIVAGAPFDLFLAADSERPARLERDGLAVKGSRFTYATGRLVLWTHASGAAAEGLALVERDDVRRIALANPDGAPYGAAARDVLVGSGRWERVRHKLVFGESVGQTFQFVASGAADAGFVALSQWIAHDAEGDHWVVPATLHRPLEQQAVLLRPSEAAARFVDYLRSDEVRGRLAELGYDTD